MTENLKEYNSLGILLLFKSIFGRYLSIYVLGTFFKGEDRFFHDLMTISVHIGRQWSNLSKYAFSDKTNGTTRQNDQKPLETTKNVIFDDFDRILKYED